MEMGFDFRESYSENFFAFPVVKSERSDKGRIKSLKRKYDCRLIFSIQHKDLKIYQHILSESKIWDLSEKMLMFIAHFMVHSYVKFIAPPSISSTHCDPKISCIWHIIQTVYVIHLFCVFHVQRKHCGFFTNRELISQTNKFTVNNSS
jgi:hypothetical protein